MQTPGEFCLAAFAPGKFEILHNDFLTVFTYNIFALQSLIAEGQALRSRVADVTNQWKKTQCQDFLFKFCCLWSCSRVPQEELQVLYAYMLCFLLEAFLKQLCCCEQK